MQVFKSRATVLKASFAGEISPVLPQVPSSIMLVFKTFAKPASRVFKFRNTGILEGRFAGQLSSALRLKFHFADFP